MNEKERLLKELADCVLNMEDEKAAGIAEKFIERGYPAQEGILKGLVVGMNQAADLYEEEEYFVSELLICSDAMYNGLDVLRPYLPKTEEEKCRVVIGVIEGDTHDIGKNIVKIMLEAAGYEMIDLGRDVPAENFIEKVKETGASVVALSTLMSTTMDGMEKVIKLLDKEGLKEKVKVIVGGGPISPMFADKIGADGYSDNAVDAVKLVNRLTKV